jgi:hypothetical protein
MGHLAAYVVIVVLAMLAFAGCATVPHPPMICGAVAPGILWCEPYEGDPPTEAPAPSKPKGVEA